MSDESDPLRIVSSTADAAFGTDEEGRVVLWNRAAERLLEYGPSDVLGRPCHEVLCGRDVFENRYCDVSCALKSMVSRREPIRGFSLSVRTKRGRIVAVELSIIVVPGPREGQHTILHLMKEVEPGRTAQAVPAASAEAGVHGTEADRGPPPETHPLTPREAEVLRHLADGLSTQEIADALFISVITVRNHVQNILRKLGVHSKLEAVALALRRRLL